jgi:Protein of unknown function (DUF3040)
VALDAEDQARLSRIESDLASADPALATRLRSWRPSAQQRATPPGWSVAPGWMLAVFLVGFTGWVLSPVVGALVVVGLAACLLWKRVPGAVRAPRRGVTRRGGQRRPRR